MEARRQMAALATAARTLLAGLEERCHEDGVCAYLDHPGDFKAAADLVCEALALGAAMGPAAGVTTSGMLSVASAALESWIACQEEVDARAVAALGWILGRAAEDLWEEGEQPA